MARGGGTTWVVGSYDPELNTLYWGTGNPNPDYYGDDRKGDNLYTCSLIAIDPVGATTCIREARFAVCPIGVYSA